MEHQVGIMLKQTRNSIQILARYWFYCKCLRIAGITNMWTTHWPIIRTWAKINLRIVRPFIVSDPVETVDSCSHGKLNKIYFTKINIGHTHKLFFSMFRSL